MNGGNNDGNTAGSKVVTITVTLGEKHDDYWQFVMEPGETVSIGRNLDCNVTIPAGQKGASGRHALLHCRRSTGGEPVLQLEDTSMNGTGVSVGTQWQKVSKGQVHELKQPPQQPHQQPLKYELLVPFVAKTGEGQVQLYVTNHGPGLPDSYDSRSRSGRWKYKGKLGEGGLGVVHRASDAQGKLTGDIAIKVCKLPKDVKATARLRSAFILHREAQWSLQVIHNTSHKAYSKQKAALFAKYLEDHTGRWSRDCDFDSERSTFESYDFRWDKFKPAEPMPPYPYVAMELVPGRTLHSALGWARDQPTDEYLNQDEKDMIMKQGIEALIYLMEMKLIHRDFRTTNLMVFKRKAAIQVRVIDLGHTILAEEHQCRNKSAVVRCNWKEDERKRFDWAPPEVKAVQPFSNFSYPMHSFDIFSFGVLTVQLHSSGMQQARGTVSRLMSEEGDKLVGKLGFSPQILSKMLGKAAGRPHAQELLEHLTNGKLRADPVTQEDKGKERRQQGGVVEEIEEVIEGEMADASASPSDNKNSARGSRASQSAAQSAVSAVHQERNSAPLSTGKTTKANAPKKDSEISSVAKRSHEGQSGPAKKHAGGKAANTLADPPASNPTKEKLESNLMRLEKSEGLKREKREMTVAAKDGKDKTEKPEKHKGAAEKRKDSKPAAADRPSEKKLRTAPDSPKSEKEEVKDQKAQKDLEIEMQKKNREEERDARRAKAQEKLLLRQLNLDDREEEVKKDSKRKERKPTPATEKQVSPSQPVQQPKTSARNGRASERPERADTKREKSPHPARKKAKGHNGWNAAAQEKASAKAAATAVEVAPEAAPEQVAPAEAAPAAEAAAPPAEAATAAAAAEVAAAEAAAAKAASAAAAAAVKAAEEAAAAHAAQQEKKARAAKDARDAKAAKEAEEARAREDAQARVAARARMASVPQDEASQQAANVARQQQMQIWEAQSAAAAEAQMQRAAAAIQQQLSPAQLLQSQLSSLAPNPFLQSVLLAHRVQQLQALAQQVPAQAAQPHPAHEGAFPISASIQQVPARGPVSPQIPRLMGPPEPPAAAAAEVKTENIAFSKSAQLQFSKAAMMFKAKGW